MASNNYPFKDPFANLYDPYDPYGKPVYHNSMGQKYYDDRDRTREMEKELRRVADHCTMLERELAKRSDDLARYPNGTTDIIKGLMEKFTQEAFDERKWAETAAESDLNALLRAEILERVADELDALLVNIDGFELEA